MALDLEASPLAAKNRPPMNTCFELLHVMMHEERWDVASWLRKVCEEGGKLFLMIEADKIQEGCPEKRGRNMGKPEFGGKKKTFASC